METYNALLKKMAKVRAALKDEPMITLNELRLLPAVERIIRGSRETWYFPFVASDYETALEEFRIREQAKAEDAAADLQKYGALEPSESSQRQYAFMNILLSKTDLAQSGLLERLGMGIDQSPWVVFDIGDIVLCAMLHRQDLVDHIAPKFSAKCRSVVTDFGIDASMPGHAIVLLEWQVSFWSGNMSDIERSTPKAKTALRKLGKKLFEDSNCVEGPLPTIFMQCKAFYTALVRYCECLISSDFIGMRHASDEMLLACFEHSRGANLMQIKLFQIVADMMNGQSEHKRLATVFPRLHDFLTDFVSKLES